MCCHQLVLSHLPIISKEYVHFILQVIDVAVDVKNDSITMQLELLEQKLIRFASTAALAPCYDPSLVIHSYLVKKK